MLRTQYSTDAFLNIGIASIKFAREYSVLFKDFIMNSKQYLTSVQPSSTNIVEQMQESTNLSGFSEEEIAGIMFKMQVFQLGLSVMDVNGMLPENFDEEKIIRLLESAGKDIIMAAKIHKMIKNSEHI